jgi:TAT (twin-arginine translocation) pathway signal sequence/Domain of unknown function (DUF362)
MATNSHPQRRDFLKTAAVGAAGAMGLGALKFDRAVAQSAGASAWVNGMAINPAIDNRRVICCNDPKMLTVTPKDTSFTTTNAAVDPAVVAANLDQMAMQLAQKTTATEAWSTIFRSSKPWASTRVAMKTNGIGGTTTNRPKWAIYKKLCDVLINLGVQPANIILYDACDNAATYYDTHVSLTDSTMIRAAKTSVRAAGMGGFADANLTNATGISVAADLLSGAVDILVNVAACKSHNGTGGHFNYGSCTLCMKNHFGTFTDGTKAQHSDNLHVGNSAASPPPTPLALIEINKHTAVLGGNPVRQQLCIVDALLSNGASGPGGAWDNRTDRLVMGTFAPIVDYCAAKNILLNATLMSTSPIPALGQTNAAIILPQFLTSFGYAATDPVWLEYEASSPPAITPGSGGTGGSGGSSGAGGSTGSSGAGGTTSSSGKGGSTSAGGSSAKGGSTVSNGGSTASNGGSTASNGGSTSAGGSSTKGGSTAGNGGTIEIGGDTGGGTTAAGGSTSNGGTTSNGGSTGAAGAVATSAPSQTGGSPATGGTTTQSSSASPVGGSTGTVASSSSASAGAKSGAGGCEVAGSGRKATRWGAMLALGTVLASKLRRLMGDDDKSS